MRKWTIILLIVFSVGLLWGEEEWIREPRFEPIVPEIAAMGGSFSAASEGWNSLYSNPAAFARDEWDVNILSVSPTLYLRPDIISTFLDQYVDLSATPMIDFGETGPEDLIDIAIDQMANNGIGGGATVGFGYVGHGFGVGIINVTDVFARGLAFDVKGYVLNTLGIVVGVSFPIELGPVTLYIGADVRPMVRIHAPLDHNLVMDLLGQLGGGGDPTAEGADAFDPMTLGLLFGYGFGIDAGIIAEWGPLSVALQARDIGHTRFFYTNMTLDDTLAAVEGAVLPEADMEIDRRIPMDLTTGISFHPDMGDIKWLIDPKIHVDIRDIITAVSDQSSFWKLLHIGAEIDFLKFINFRVGLNQGYLTGGAGLLLPGFNLYASFFTKEFEESRFVGDDPVSGLSFEFAIRI